MALSKGKNASGLWQGRVDLSLNSLPQVFWAAAAHLSDHSRSDMMVIPKSFTLLMTSILNSP